MRLADRIHETPYRVVLAVTGGGSEVVGSLLRHGNGSATLIEAIVPYSLDAMDDFLGGKPDKYCSPSAARAMAMRAFQRAVHLSDGKDVLGIGATCKLAKASAERKGRSHEIYVASQSEARTTLATLILRYPRTRENEEEIAGALIMNILARACGLSQNVLPIYPDQNEELVINESVVNPEIQELICGRSKVARISIRNDQQPPKIVFPGSFNPLHKNHVAIAKYAYEKLGSPVSFEISVENVDKPTLDYLTIEERLAGFEQFRTPDCPWMGDVYLTNAPLFAQKANLFPGATFLVGYDTLTRISNPRYYLPHEFEAAMESLRNNRFLAFHRVNADVNIAPQLEAVSEVVAPQFYTDDGTSSTKIRKGENGEEGSSKGKEARLKEAEIG